MKSYPSIILFLFIFLVLPALFLAKNMLNRPAENNPSICNYKENLSRKKLVTMGDSITHGVVSSNYSRLIEEEVSKYGFLTVNAGMNSDLSITALRKINNVIACKPDIVTILIGTNDVLAVKGGLQRGIYNFSGRVKKEDEVSEEAFYKNLSSIVRKLKRSGIENIFLISIPVIGEDISGEMNILTKHYSKIIKNISDLENVNYIALNEAMRMRLKNNVRISNPKRNILYGYYLMARHYYLGESLTSLYGSDAYRFLTDGVHLNNLGADLLASLVLEAFNREGLLED